MPQERLTKQIFLEGLQSNGTNGSWTSQVCNIFCENGLKDSFESRECVNVENFWNTLMCRKRNILWEQCLAKPKLRTYAKITDIDKIPAYIKNQNRFDRMLLSKLRFGILPLRIEIGRYIGLKESECICQLCENNKIENEIHFLCK